MAGKDPRRMRPRDERAHPLIKDALEKGHLDTGKPYVVDGFGTHEAANEGRLSIGRAGQHLNVSTAAWVADQHGNSCYKDCQDPEAPHSVYFRLHSKNSARKHVTEQSGGDPANLKYNPFRRAEPPLVDDHGRRI